MYYEWDDAKNAANFKKHGMYFDAVFSADWGSARIAEDTRIDYGEARFQAYLFISKRLHVVVYAKRKNARRIISVRKANRRERKLYAQASH